MGTCALCTLRQGPLLPELKGMLSESMVIFKCFNPSYVSKTVCTGAVHFTKLCLLYLVFTIYNL